MSKPSLISCCNICKRPCDTMYHRGSILQSYLDKDIYTSCKAAKLAAVQAILPLSLISTKLSVSGRINSSAPVSLFMAVCSDKSFFSAAKSRPPLGERLFGAGGRTRTGTTQASEDFKSAVSTIPPHRHIKAFLQANILTSCEQSVNNYRITLRIYTDFDIIFYYNI